MALVLLLAAPAGCDPQTIQQVIVKCGTVIGLTPEQQKRAAAELRKLPPGSVVGGMILPDWLRMRDEARACVQKELRT